MNALLLCSWKLVIHFKISFFCFSKDDVYLNKFKMMIRIYFLFSLLMLVHIGFAQTKDSVITQLSYSEANKNESKIYLLQLVISFSVFILSLFVLYLIYGFMFQEFISDYLLLLKNIFYMFIIMFVLFGLTRIIFCFQHNK